jgi:hypothetical protein
VIRGAVSVLVGAAAILAAVAAPASAAKKPPHIKHVFIIVLENKNYAETFGPDTKAPYLAKRLARRGERLNRYYGVAHDSLANYIAMTSGQGPSVQTQADCQNYTEFAPGTPAANGQYLGQGCVFPNGVENVANQLEGAGYTWKAYQERMNATDPGGHGTPGRCRHPSIGGSDSGTGAFTDGYVTKHNPFVYFHSIIDFPTCAKNDIDFSKLRKHLRRGATTPNYSFITPTMCNDGHNEPCEDGRPGGLKTANKWLRRHVPRILRSPGFRDRGLLLILFDEARALEDDPGNSDPSACCGETQAPNTPNNAGLEPGLGGGRTGAVLLSPCIKRRTVNRHPYNHYSMLRWVEDNFGLPHLGYAGQAGLKPFDSKVLNRRGCRARVHLRVRPKHPDAGSATTYKLKARSYSPACRARVRIRFAGRTVRTNRRGRARVTANLAPGRHIAKGKKPGCRPGRRAVTVG